MKRNIALTGLFAAVLMMTSCKSEITYEQAKEEVAKYDANVVEKYGEGKVETKTEVNSQTGVFAKDGKLYELTTKNDNEDSKTSDTGVISADDIEAANKAKAKFFKDGGVGYQLTLDLKDVLQLAISAANLLAKEENKIDATIEKADITTDVYTNTDGVYVKVVAVQFYKLTGKDAGEYKVTYTSTVTYSKK
jgi:hypothetical protein